MISDLISREHLRHLYKKYGALTVLQLLRGPSTPDHHRARPEACEDAAEITEYVFRAMNDTAKESSMLLHSLRAIHSSRSLREILIEYVTPMMSREQAQTDRQVVSVSEKSPTTQTESCDQIVGGLDEEGQIVNRHMAVSVFETSFARFELSAGAPRAAFG